MLCIDTFSYLTRVRRNNTQKKENPTEAESSFMLFVPMQPQGLQSDSAGIRTLDPQLRRLLL